MPDTPRPAGFSLEDAVLDIGGDIGALILYADAEYDEREIEVSPIDEGDHAHEQADGAGEDHDTGHGHGHRTHTAIHQRQAGGSLTYAGIYPELKAGEYRIWTDDPGLPDRVVIVGGEVAEVDWRSRRS
jgi:hypothetical protein